MPQKRPTVCKATALHTRRGTAVLDRDAGLSKGVRESAADDARAAVFPGAADASIPGSA